MKITFFSYLKNLRQGKAFLFRDAFLAQTLVGTFATNCYKSRKWSVKEKYLRTCNQRYL